ncbi:hypothetical protein SNEBB_008580, partial [Seison nebaliae]
MKPHPKRKRKLSGRPIPVHQKKQKPGTPTVEEETGEEPFPLEKDSDVMTISDSSENPESDTSTSESEEEGEWKEVKGKKKKKKNQMQDVTQPSEQPRANPGWNNRWVKPRLNHQWTAISYDIKVPDLGKDIMKLNSYLISLETPIEEVKPLPSGKILVGFSSEADLNAFIAKNQEKNKILFRRTSASQEDPKKTIVLVGVPTSLTNEFLVEYTEAVKANRIVARDGTETTKVKVTFSSTEKAEKVPGRDVYSSSEDSPVLQVPIIWPPPVQLQEGGRYLFQMCGKTPEQDMPERSGQMCQLWQDPQGNCSGMCSATGIQREDTAVLLRYRSKETRHYSQPCSSSTEAINLAPSTSNPAGSPTHEAQEAQSASELCSRSDLSGSNQSSSTNSRAPSQGRAGPKRLDGCSRESDVPLRRRNNFRDGIRGGTRNPEPSHLPTPVKTVLNLGLLNVHGLLSSLDELKLFLRLHAIDVIGLLETWSDQAPAIQGFDSILIPAHVGRRGRRHRGAILYSKTELKLEAVVKQDTPSYTIILASGTIGDLILVYVHPHATEQPNISQLIESRRHLKKRVILLGDFNAWHPQINLNDRTKTNAAGKNLADTLTAKKLTVISPDFPTFPQHGSRPDLIAISTENIAEVERTYVNGDVTSDHFAVVACLTLDGIPTETGVQIRDWSKADWQGFENFLKRKSEGIIVPVAPGTTTLDSLAEDWTEMVREAVETFVPTKIYKPSRPLNGIPHAILKLIKNRKKLRRTFRRTREQSLKSTINRITKEIRRKLAETRQKNTDFLMKKLNHLKRGDSSFWSTLKKIQPRKAIPAPILISGDRSLASNPVEVAEIFAKYQAEICSRPEGGDFEPSDETIREHRIDHPWIYQRSWKFASWEESDSITEVINSLEFERHLQETKNKSPGHDGITRNLMMKLPAEAKAKILEIYNAALKTGYFPAVWKRARVIMILKPGKDPQIPESYRPISLLSVPGKIFERILNARLQNVIESNKIFGEEQMGFRKGRGTNLQLKALMTDIGRAKSLGNQITALLFDVSKAFDRLWHEGLMYKLFNTGIFKNRSLRLLNSFLSNRTIQVNVKGELSQTKHITAGSPQGSVLSATLYILSLFDLPESLGRRENVKIFQYADDLCVTLETSKKDEKKKGQEVLQQTIKDLESFARTWRISYNPHKTKQLQLLYSGVRNFELSMLGVTLPVVTEAQYLGITLDKRMNLNAHAKKVVAKAWQRVNSMRQ